MYVCMCLHGNIYNKATYILAKKKKGKYVQSKMSS